MARYQWGEKGWYQISSGYYSKRTQNGDMHVQRVSVESARVRKHQNAKRDYMWRDGYGGLWPTMREAMIASDGER